jgi:dihydropteroate synthase-like protein
MTVPHWLFVTGKLAEPALRRILRLSMPQASIDFSVATLPISVAALATTRWISEHLTIPLGVDRVILPGLCPGELDLIRAGTEVSVERGPEDLRDLPDYLGSSQTVHRDLNSYDITIIAELNDVQRLTLSEIRAHAGRLVRQGADIIDLGCQAGVPWPGVAETVRALREEGFRVSIDSFNVHDVQAAARAGAELVLSVNGSNRQAARDWGCEVVAIPDQPADLDSLAETVEVLDALGVRYRIDPVLEPIGFGFAASLGRYIEARKLFPAVEMLMGIGNLTELTDVDSAGVNVILAGFCQEMGIRSVLTTEVINWCQTAVRELDLARRLVYCSCRDHILPKHLMPELLILRDPKLREHGEATIRELAKQVKDRHFRLFAERGRLIVFNNNIFVEGSDAFSLFSQILKRELVDPAHAFYLGYEMAKATTALRLGKNYVQDQELRWGFLTTPERDQQAKMMRHDGEASAEPK